MSHTRNTRPTDPHPHLRMFGYRSWIQEAPAPGQQVAHNVKTAAKRQQEVERARLRQREWH